MKKLAAALGMKEEGRRREAAFKHAKYIDIIEFGVLREEYQALRKQSRRRKK
jgi:ribosomal-protein-alanine N-acetyltransferase